MGKEGVQELISNLSKDRGSALTHTCIYCTSVSVSLSIFLAPPISKILSAHAPNRREHPRGRHQEDGVANGGRQRAGRNGALIGRRRTCTLVSAYIYRQLILFPVSVGGSANGTVGVFLVTVHSVVPGAAVVSEA